MSVIDQEMRPSPACLRDFEKLAKQILPPTHYDYFAGGSGDENTVIANERAFPAIKLVPHVLRGSTTVNMGRTLFGCPMSMPVFISPTAFHALAHNDGERGTAAAAAYNRIPMIISMASTTGIEDIIAAARQRAEVGVFWFQCYIQQDRSFMKFLLRRVQLAGCSAIVVTVDSPVFGRKERDIRNRFHDLPSGMTCPNMLDGEGRQRSIGFSREFSWADIEWIKTVTDLPLILKGILHPQDALKAVELGVNGLIVSNHGGRQLDTAVTSIEALPAIAAAVKGRVPLLLDGGVRRGTDVVKALAFGADAVGLGRPVIWGLATAGEAGVNDVLSLLREEIAQTMALCGLADSHNFGMDIIHDGKGRGFSCS